MITSSKQPPAADRDGVSTRDVTLTHVEDHSEENDDAEPEVEGSGEECDGDDDVCDGGQDLEDEVAEQHVDGGCAAVHDTQYLSRLPAQVPAQTETVQVGKQVHLEHTPVSQTTHCVTDRRTSY